MMNKTAHRSIASIRDTLIDRINNHNFYQNITTVFILPLVHRELNWMNLHIKYDFVTSFKYEKGNEEHLEIIMIFKDTDRYNSFLTKFDSKIDIVNEEFITVDDKNYIKCTVSINKRFDKDITKIMEGKYSKISEEARNQYEHSHLLPIEKNEVRLAFLSLAYIVINKEPEILYVLEKRFGIEMSEEEMREESTEVWTLFNKEKETLDVESMDISKYL